VFSCQDHLEYYCEHTTVDSIIDFFLRLLLMYVAWPGSACRWSPFLKICRIVGESLTREKILYPCYKLSTVLTTSILHIVALCLVQWLSLLQISSAPTRLVMDFMSSSMEKVCMGNNQSHVSHYPNAHFMMQSTMSQNSLTRYLTHLPNVLSP